MSSYKTIRDRIEAKEFEHKLPYPLDEELEKDEGYLKLKKEVEQHKLALSKLYKELQLLKSDMANAYDNESSEIRAKFKEALEKEYDMQNHPKKDKIWEKAWEDGHSGGWTEILITYDELVNLVSHFFL